MQQRSLTIRIFTSDEDDGDIKFIEVEGEMAGHTRSERFPDELMIMKLLVLVELLLEIMGEVESPDRSKGVWN